MKERTFLSLLHATFIKFGRFWRLYPHQTKLLDTLTEGSSHVKLISLLSDGWIIPLGLIGFLLSLPLWKRHLFISLWIWSYCIGFTIFYYPMVRYRLPVMPFVMLFTGYCLFWGYKKLKKKDEKIEFRMW